MNKMWRCVCVLLAWLFLLTTVMPARSKNNCERKEKSWISLDIAEDIFPNCTDGPGNNSDCGMKDKASVYLDIVNNLISEGKKNYPQSECDNSSSVSSQCEEREKLLFYLGSGMSLISDIEDHIQKESEPSGPEVKSRILHEKPMDCSQVLQNGHSKSGIYSIWPGSRIPDRPLEVYCDMDTDGGGWTVIQKRGKFTPQENFYRDWFWYKHGFGNLSREFWIGNENLYKLSNQARYKIRFDLEDVGKNKGFAVYQSFRIEDEATQYKLHIEDYSGDVGDSMELHNTMLFSTKDMDNDLRSGSSCSVNMKGGWWYNKCVRTNLNGVYLPGVKNDIQSIYWDTWQLDVGLAAVEIKLRNS